MPFEDRTDAGRQLAEHLADLRSAEPIVLGLARGGVVVGSEIAQALGAPLDVLTVRKLGAPGNPEYGFGAIAPGGVRFVDEDSAEMLRLTDKEIAQIAEVELAELQRQNKLYRGERPAPQIADRTVILVDDGLATGVTARAAIQAIRQQGPSQLVLAVPVAPPETARALAAEVDLLVCLETPLHFQAVGQWYRSFQQTTDQEVTELLGRARSS